MYSVLVPVFDHVATCESAWRPAADVQVTPIEEGYDFPETAADLAAWSGGEVTWAADDLAVVRAVY